MAKRFTEIEMRVVQFAQSVIPSVFHTEGITLLFFTENLFKYQAGSHPEREVI